MQTGRDHWTKKGTAAPKADRWHKSPTTPARELSAIGNNVNQIAHAVNAKKDVSEGEIDEALHLVRQAWRLVKDSF